jgi:hypothetical protein
MIVVLIMIVRERKVVGTKKDQNLIFCLKIATVHAIDINMKREHRSGHSYLHPSLIFTGKASNLPSKGLNTGKLWALALPANIRLGRK